MGSLERRVIRLESLSWKRAEERLKEYFESVSDMDVALIAASVSGHPRLSPTQEAAARVAHRRVDHDEINRLLKLAAPPGVLDSDESTDYWLRGFVERCFFSRGRKERLNRCFEQIRSGQ